MNPKEVFQLAQTKGYATKYDWPFVLSIYSGNEVMELEEKKLIELTLIQKWLRDEKEMSVYVIASLGEWLAFHSKKSMQVARALTYERALLMGIADALKHIN